MADIIGPFTEPTPETLSIQSRMRNPIFWIGMVCCAYEAVIHALATAHVDIPVWASAIGIGLSAVLAYCNSNNPSLASH